MPNYRQSGQQYVLTSLNYDLRRWWEKELFRLRGGRGLEKMVKRTPEHLLFTSPALLITFLSFWGPRKSSVKGSFPLEFILMTLSQRHLPQNIHPSEQRWRTVNPLWHNTLHRGGLTRFLSSKIPLFSYRQNPRLSDTVLFLCIIGPKCSHQPNPESTNTLRSCRVYRPTFKCPTQSRCPRFRGALPIFHSWMVLYLFFCRYSADESLLLGC